MDEDSCCICLDQLVSSKTTTLICKHILHDSCFKEYTSYCIKKNVSVLCPLCNVTIEDIAEPKINKVVCKTKWRVTAIIGIVMIFGLISFAIFLN